MNYTKEQKKFIRSIALGKSNIEIIELFYIEYNIRITKAQMKCLKANNNIASGLTGHFVKGQTSWNKGKKLQTIGRMADTQFKKGQFSPNRLPIGSERLSKEGYHEVKIQDGHMGKNWKAKHRILWEEVNGSIPNKHRIVFLDGDKNNITIENLALMTFEQTAVMSARKLFYKNPELTKLGSKIAEIELKVNEKKRSIKNANKHTNQKVDSASK